MSKRKLKRQLNLAQVIMLGTAGTLAAEIFVLTGHAAGMAGPAAVLAFLVGGLLTYSVALNYCELATAYPVAGGAMSYVREGFGNGILSYLVGSMDAMSSTFYAALSAVGFAYSLKVFLPELPIVPTAGVVIGLFGLLNVVGVTKVGNLQVVLGAVLLAVFGIYIVAGLAGRQGFSMTVFLSGRELLAGGGFWLPFTQVLATISLVYNAYVGFEVIADDAEEVQHPNRTIPVGILVSLTLCMVIYVLVGLVTIGTVPWRQLAGSETALTDAVRQFLPAWGVPMMGVAGMIATLTSINTAMLSATREAFTLSRDGVWPRVLAKLSRYRTPYVSILGVALVSILVAIIGLVDLLSYISSVGYLFVLFWGSLAMIRLRKRDPDIQRPFRAPLFPATAYVAAASSILIVAFADWRALAFGSSVVVALTITYYVAPRLTQHLVTQVETVLPDRDLILVAASKPRTARSLVHLASIIAQASEDTYICVVAVQSVAKQLASLSAHRVPKRLGVHERALLDYAADSARERNVALYSKSRSATSVARGLLDEARERNDRVKLMLVGWPGPLDGRMLIENPVKALLRKARTNVVALLDRGLLHVDQILVPVGGGPHSRLALRLAYEIGAAESATVTALRIVPPDTDQEELEDQQGVLEETIEEVLGSVPPSFRPQIVAAASVPEGIVAESERQAYDLVVIGASEEWAWRTRLFGSVVDWIGGVVPCSVLFCRRYEPVMIAWLRRRMKALDRTYAYEPNGGRIGLPDLSAATAGAAGGNGAGAVRSRPSPQPAQLEDRSPSAQLAKLILEAGSSGDEDEYGLGGFRHELAQVLRARSAAISEEDVGTALEVAAHSILHPAMEDED
ncbi:MAG: amino acid permease [Anaerolineae bacterium]|nr:amino acid permease [Anaerolineae bacterium]